MIKEAVIENGKLVVENYLLNIIPKDGLENNKKIQFPLEGYTLIRSKEKEKHLEIVREKTKQIYIFKNLDNIETTFIRPTLERKYVYFVLGKNLRYRERILNFFRFKLNEENSLIFTAVEKNKLFFISSGDHDTLQLLFVKGDKCAIYKDQNFYRKVVYYLNSYKENLREPVLQQLKNFLKNNGMD